MLGEASPSGIGKNSNYHMFISHLQFPLSKESSCSCLGHVINLGNIDIMSHITKIAAVENLTAIWEYICTCSDNHVLGGSLDMIATIHTLAIKVRMSQCPKLTFMHKTNDMPLDSGVWTAYQIFPEYPAPLWTPRSRENSIAQQLLMGNGLQHASPGKPSSPSKSHYFSCSIWS